MDEIIRQSEAEDAEREAAEEEREDRAAYAAQLALGVSSPTELELLKSVALSLSLIAEATC